MSAGKVSAHGHATLGRHDWNSAAPRGPLQV